MLAFTPLKEEGKKTARLEQRMTVETKVQIEKAAALLGVTPSEFVLTTAAQAARDTLNQFDGTDLKAQDVETFNQALMNTEPTPELCDMMRLHKSVIQN